MLNNIGKLREINSEYESDYTFEGNLIGHKVISRDMIRESIDRIKNFPDSMAKKIEHILISDLGLNSFKYQKTPSFPEALLVHLIDLLDSKMSLMEIALDQDQDLGFFTNQYNYFRTPLLKKDGSK